MDTQEKREAPLKMGGYMANTASNPPDNHSTTTPIIPCWEATSYLFFQPPHPCSQQDLMGRERGASRRCSNKKIHMEESTTLLSYMWLCAYDAWYCCSCLVALRDNISQ